MMMKVMARILYDDEMPRLHMHVRVRFFMHTIRAVAVRAVISLLIIIIIAIISTITIIITIMAS